MESTQIIQQFMRMRSDVNQLAEKINQLELELREHTLVVDTIEPLDPSRRCYRMIGDVLVERTVGETIPAVKSNRDGIAQLIKNLNEQLAQRQRIMNEFQTKYKIRISNQSDRAAPAQAQKSTGVLA
ncbi:putative prefoldin subunit 2 [Paratrimastix pyriformis]|uniref:Prefoldin subunit 2 n=1 Tax=Paratrimastix pyriformis TaxID=342808 RepID=A0ABQ8UT66_9EUKA|nr:putative prefoldin subunit 2 [Paratrimastix pyriformis]